MANVNNSCISCERVDFCHHRQTSPPSGFVSDGGDMQSDGGDKSLQMALNRALNIIIDHNKIPI